MVTKGDGICDALEDSAVLGNGIFRPTVFIWIMLGYIAGPGREERASYRRDRPALHAIGGLPMSNGH